MRSGSTAAGRFGGHGRRTHRNPRRSNSVDDVDEATAADVRRRASRRPTRGAAGDAMPAIERGQTAARSRGTRCARTARACRELLTREGGKPRIENLDEVEWCAACFQYYAEIARNSYGTSIPPTAEHQINFTIKEPLGVVGAIVPFNYPLLLLVWKIAPALAAGNTVVIKPSELTPLATLRLVEHAMRHLPTGVVNVVTGGPEVGAALVDDPGCGVHRVHGVDGGRDADRGASGGAVEARESGAGRHRSVASSSRTPISTSRCRARRGPAFSTTDRSAPSAKRIYVVEPIAKAFVERFIEHARSLRLGNGWTPTPISVRSSPSGRASGWKSRCAGRGRRGRAAVGRGAAGGRRGPG